MLFDAYEKVRCSRHLKDIPQEHHLFGSLGELPVSAAPRILWMPTQDDYTAPRPVATPSILGGRRVEVEAIWTREAGADVELVVPAGPQGYRAMEDLIRRFHLALREALVCTGNYRVTRGHWRDREAVSTATLAYVQPLEVMVPIWDVVPAQLWEETAVRMG